MADGRGNKKGEVHAVFTNRLDDHKAQCKKQAEAFKGDENRPWQVPNDFWGALLDVPGLHDPSYDRDKINTNYLKCFQDVDDFGTTGDVIGLKLQIDYVAAEERAWRHRHASLARCHIHAMGRRLGLGQSRTFPAISKQASNAIANGASK